MFIRRSYCIEVLALIIVLLASCIVLHHLSLPAWKPMFLFDGDSLTLPLLMKRLFEDKSFMWVASAQSMVFPELIIYSICYVLTPSIEWSLILNAVINVLLLYLGLRLVASQFELCRSKQVNVALTTTLLFLCLMLLEDNPTTAIATFYLFNTYYCGILIIGLFLLYTVMRLMKLVRFGRAQIVGLVALPIVVISCAVFSNPMIIVQVLIPLMAVVWLFWGAKIIQLSYALCIILGGATAIIIGFIGRFFAIDYLGQTLASHIGGHAYTQAIRFILQSIKMMASTTSGLIFLLILATAWCLCIFYSIRFLKKRKNSDELNYLLCSSFSLIQIICCSVVFIMYGKMVLRYYLPLTLFPLLGFWPLMSRLSWPKWFRFFGVLTLTGLGFNSWSHIISLSSAADLPELHCVDKALAGRDDYGVADYWAARAFNLYGKQNYQLLQTTFLFNVLPWQENLARYENKTIHFILTTDNLQKSWYREGISEDEVKVFIGTVDKQIACGAIKVLFLDKHSPEFQRLNQKIHRSYAKIMSMRRQHKLSEFLGG